MLHLPGDVVDGKIGGMKIIVFHHGTRFTEGFAKEWFVAGISAVESLADRCTIQFCRKSLNEDSAYLTDPIVKEYKSAKYRLIVRAPDSPSTGLFTDNRILDLLGSLAVNLRFRPEIQVRGKRIVVYLADRNSVIDHSDDLENLVNFSRKVVDICKR